MKKILLSMFALLAAVPAMYAAEEKEPEILDVLTDYTPDKEKNDYYFEFQNEDYLLAYNLKEVPQVGKTYTMEDVYPDYTYVRSKDEVITNQFGTPEWRTYMITDLSLTFSEVDAENKVFKFTASTKAEVGIYRMEKDFTFDAPEVITVSLTGECEYIADLDLYSFSAKNKGSEVKNDYRFSIGIKGSAWASGNFVTSDLYVRGNEIKVSGRDAVKITGADLALLDLDEDLLLTGTVTDANGQVYEVSILTNTIGGDTETVEVDLGATLKVSEDEGDIKFKAETPEHQFVGYITCATTNVPSGSYDLLSYSKYGDWNSTFGMYMSDSFTEGKVDVVNTAGDIAITATFKQGNKNYKVTAATTSTGISTTTATAALPVRKYLDNGRLVILKGDRKFALDATEIK